MHLIELLPSYYKENETMVTLQDLLSNNVNQAEESFNKTIDQCYVSTTTDIIARYEKMYGIKTDIHKSIEIRREKVRSKMSGVGTFNRKMVEYYLSAFIGGKATLIEDVANSKFTLKFDDYYVVPTDEAIAEIYAITDELKPAHLGYNHGFTYEWWNRVNGAKTWNDLGTWQGIRDYGGAE